MKKNQKGELIFWSITDFNVETAELERRLKAVDLEVTIPRNKYRAIMLRTLRTLLRGNERFYRKFRDTVNSCSFAVIDPIEADDDIEFKKEFIVSLDKISGEVKFSTKGLFQSEILKTYKATQGTIDAGQFRTMVLEVVKKTCYGISMRRGGGIYFIDKRFAGTKEKLEKLFSAFPENTRLLSVPIYDDSATEEALEHAASDDIFSEIEELLADMSAKVEGGNFSRKVLEGRKEEAKRIFEKIQVHEVNLRSKADDVKKKLTNISKAMEAVTGKIEEGIFEAKDFYEELKLAEQRRIKKGMPV